MHASVRILVVLALMLAPAAAASWKSAGQQEPDTPYDVARGRMFTTTDSASDGVRRVYFNAYPAFYVTSFDPNVAALGTRLHVMPTVHYQALLGVWKDCNLDGYVGMAEGALREYRATLLPETTPCPARAPGPGVHNDGQWVAEMLMIGGPDPCEYVNDAQYKETECADARQGPGVDRTFSPNPHVLYANGTLVWGDAGEPGYVLPTGASPCPITPLPRGTTSGTGHLLAYLDCEARVATGTSIVRAFDDASRALDPDDALGLRFDDASSPERSGSRLNQHFPVNLYGSPTTGKSGLIERDAEEGPAFRAWDCSTSSPDPSLDDADASWWDGASFTFDGIAGDCDPRTKTQLDDAYPAVERGSAPPPGAKTRATVYFIFNDGARGTSADPVDIALGESTPADLGVGYGRRLNDPTRRDNNGGPQWDAHTNVVVDPPLVTREGTPAGRQHMTFYAKLAGATITSWGLTLPTSTEATYGAEPTNCGDGIGTGRSARGGFACDPAAWYRTPEGADAMPSTAEGPVKGQRLAPRVGERYHLLDVDCLDGRVAEGVYASLARASPDGPCPTPSE